MTIESITQILDYRPTRITMRQACLILHCHENTIRYRIKVGLMPEPIGHKHTPRRAWPVEQFIDWCNENDEPRPQ